MGGGLKLDLDFRSDARTVGDSSVNALFGEVDTTGRPGGPVLVGLALILAAVIIKALR